MIGDGLIRTPHSREESAHLLCAQFGCEPPHSHNVAVLASMTLNTYEQERIENIASNHQRLCGLGLAGCVARYNKVCFDFPQCKQPVARKAKSFCCIPSGPNFNTRSMSAREQNTKAELQQSLSAFPQITDTSLSVIISTRKRCPYGT